MADLTFCLTNLIFQYSILFRIYANLNLSIICRIFSGDIYISFGIYISVLASSKLFCEGFFEWNSFEAPVSLSVILLPIKPPVATAVSRTAYFGAVFISSSVDFWHNEEVFYCIHCLNFTHFFSKWWKFITFYRFLLSWFNWITHLYNNYIIYLLKLFFFYLLFPVVEYFDL